VRITASRQVEGGRIVSEIGRIEAASEWGGEGLTEARRASALEKLKELAREYEADAIVGLDFSVDDVQATDLAPLPRRRVSASGVAVKLARG